MKNFITRTLTGIIFVLTLVGAICFNPVIFAIVFSLLVALSINEFSTLLKDPKEKSFLKIIRCLGGVYLFVASFLYAGGYLGVKIFLPYILFGMYLLIIELYNKADNPIRNWSFAVLGQVYYALPFALMNFILFTQNPGGEIIFTPILLLALFVFIWTNDTGAFLIGSLFGKHRLFERISPKKSWEGFYGGLIFALTTSLIFGYFYSEINYYQWLGLAFTIVVFGTWGDLTESLLKRTIGVKDSGSILPGHGGMLDRFDSVMMAAPAALIYIELFIR